MDFSFRRPHLKFPCVEDHAHAAELVAEHFLTRGFKNFAFYSDTDNWSYAERGNGFVQAIKRAGYECAWLPWYRSPDYRADRDQWKRKRAWLTHQIQRAPKPLAIFAANDDQALDVLESCQAAKLTVPEQVAIVGAENSLLAPDAMLTPISSVDTNLELLGYRGAELLDELMHGKKGTQDATACFGRQLDRPQKQRPARHAPSRRVEQPALHLGKLPSPHQRERSRRCGGHVPSRTAQGISRKSRAHSRPGIATHPHRTRERLLAESD